jgi:ATP-dependent Clp protease ATP-binding subunit ClpA
MFERFTDRARRVVVLAQEEARSLDHNYIGTEHILLGMLREGEGVAAKALEELGIGLDAIRQQVVEIIGRGQQLPSGHIPFTPRAKKVLELSLRESLQLGHEYIGTEHILLGMLREGEGVAAKALEELGIGLDAIRQQVVEIIGRGQQLPSGHIPFTPRAKKVLELSLRESLQLGHEYIGTEHILLGLIREGEGVAAQVLTRLGATKDRVQQQVLQLLQDWSGSERMPTGEPVQRTAVRVVGSAQLDEIVERLESIAERLTAIERHLGLGDEPAGREDAGPEGTGPGDSGQENAAQDDASAGDTGTGG